MLTDETAGTVRLGGDLEVRRLGFGTLYITTGRGFGAPSSGAKDLLEEAVALGVNFIDTADSYGPGHAENAICETLHPYRGLVIATKGGFTRPSKHSWTPDGRPEYLRSALEGSLKRLRVDRIDLYQHHTPDHRVPYAESVGTLRDLQKEGKIRHVGVSNVDLDQLKEARREVEVASVQNPFNIADRRDEDVLDFCEENGIAFIPWRPLSDGRLPGRSSPVRQVADKHGVTLAQVMLAVLLQRSSVMLPIPGTGSVDHLRENIAAAALRLDKDDLALLWP
jgi:aryl-alcohol dehydrogenase-like predicted oxidoreductase